MKGIETPRCEVHEADLAASQARVKELEAEVELLKERLAEIERQVPDSIDLETELNAIDDVVTGSMPPEAFEPATGTLGRVIKALAAGGAPNPTGNGQWSTGRPRHEGGEEGDEEC